MVLFEEQVLQALEAAREEYPDQAHWFDFHRRLLAAQWMAEKSLSPLTNPVTPERVEARREAHQPVFLFDELEVDWPVMQRLLDRVGELAARHWPDWTRAAQLEARPDLVCAWYQGQESLEPRTAFLLTEALRPFLHRAAAAAGPYLPAEGYQNWGWCPLCAGEPDLATLDQETGARRLFCNRCDTGWRYMRIGCPFCGTDNPYELAYYLSSDPVYRVYVCECCRRYLKTLDLRQARRPFYLAVERVRTAGLDLAAQEAGYGG